MYPESLQELIQGFKYLPGIGEKTAERLAFAVLDLDSEQVELFSDSIQKVKSKIHACKVCNTLTEDDILLTEDNYNFIKKSQFLGALLLLIVFNKL